MSLYADRLSTKEEPLVTEGEPLAAESWRQGWVGEKQAAYKKRNYRTHNLHKNYMVR